MKLPNGERAIIDVAGKLVGYCLNPSHRTGRHKARVFRSVLGITVANPKMLADALRAAARDRDAKVKDKSPDATKYEIELPVTGPRGTAVVRSGWIIETGTSVPRLTSCYVKRTGGSRGQRTQTS